MSALLIVGTGLGLMRTRIESPCVHWQQVGGGACVSVFA
jgi:hypothetical protein